MSDAENKNTNDKQSTVSPQKEFKPERSKKKRLYMGNELSVL